MLVFQNIIKEFSSTNIAFTSDRFLLQGTSLILVGMELNNNPEVVVEMTALSVQYCCSFKSLLRQSVD